eukprot:1118339-Pelagomonas_calceolata.AAC.1
MAWPGKAGHDNPLLLSQQQRQQASSMAHPRPSHSQPMLLPSQQLVLRGAGGAGPGLSSGGSGSTLGGGTR